MGNALGNILQNSADGPKRKGRLAPALSAIYTRVAQLQVSTSFCVSVPSLRASAQMSLPSVKRLETQPGPLAAQLSTIAALRTALEKAGIVFVPENGAGPGVRLKKKSPRK